MTGDGEPSDAELNQLMDLLGNAEGEPRSLGGYRILELVGEGGMGLVFRAEDSGLSRDVALKVMKPSAMINPDAKERFLREAKAAGTIEHDNIVSIFKVGEDGGIPFIAMSLLDGESLQKLFDREKRLEQERLVVIGRQVAEGLSAAHASGLIHRDIKPDNIWIERESGLVKILDFGIARMTNFESELTHSEAVMGTPRYMAPEQASAEPVDFRSDLFSLGSVLYHMLAGKPAFDGSNLTATLMAVSLAEETPIAEHLPDINPGLATLITSLLQRDPTRRPKDAFEVVRIFDAIATNQPVVVATADTDQPSKNKHFYLTSLAVVGAIITSLGFGLFLANDKSVPKVKRVRTLVAPIRVTSTTDETDTFPAENLINGSGLQTLSINDYSNLLHETASEETAWVTNDPGGHPSNYFDSGIEPELTFYFDSEKLLTQLILWGYFLQGIANRNEAQSIEIAFSEDAGVSFGTPILMQHELTGRAAETIDFGGEFAANAVRIRITDNHHVPGAEIEGGDRVGLGEVRFVAMQAESSSGASPPYDAQDDELPQWTAPENLGPVVNFALYNYAPWLSEDRLELWFSANNMLKGEVDDIYIARRETINSAWRKPESLGSPINTPDRESEFVISEDRLELTFLRNNILMRSLRDTVESNWPEPEVVPSVAQQFIRSPVMSADEKTLYIGIYNFGTGKTVNEKSDIFKMTRTSRTLDWSEPIRIKGRLNSLNHDWPSAISQDHCTIVIESDRPGGVGEIDHWMAKRPSAEAHWGVPFNLGTTINSQKIDKSSWLSADGKMMILTSAREAGTKGSPILSMYQTQRVDTPVD